MRTNRVVIVGLAILAGVCGVLLLRGEPRETTVATVSGNTLPSRERERAEEDPVQRELIARYSGARVNLARHAADAALDLDRSVLEIGLRLRDLHRSKQRPKSSMFIPESPLEVLRRRFGATHGELQLSPEQEEQVVTIVLDLFDEQTLDFRERIERLESRKDELQRLMLASDACHRKDLTEEDYRSILAATDEEMREAL
ncbi:MAG: hypothetical protein EOP84_24200, partial [Verrucomicrobiaceae bacterium]